MCPLKEKYCGSIGGCWRVRPDLPQLLHGVVESQPGPDVGAVNVGLAGAVPGVGAVDGHVELQVLCGDIFQAKMEQEYQSESQLHVGRVVRSRLRSLLIKYTLTRSVIS